MSGAHDEFVPTKDQRQIVRLMASIMEPHVGIAKAIINPETKRPISPVTLRKAFPEELSDAHAQVKAFAVGKLFELITKGTPSAIFFYLKTKCGFKETNVHEFQGLGSFDLTRLTDAELDDIRAGRVTADLLSRLRNSSEPGPAGPVETIGSSGSGEAAPAERKGSGDAPGDRGHDKPVADPADG